MTIDSWKTIEREAARLASVRLLDLFDTDPRRVQKLTLTAPHLVADFSKQHIDDGALAALAQAAEAADLEGWRAKMFAGDEVNSSEHRPAMHWALRARQPRPEIAAVRQRMTAFANKIRPEIDAIIHLGIGGSDLGPRLLIDALKPHRRKGLDIRFAANVDGADVVDAIDGLDPRRTLLIVVSKTFTTQETLANASFVRAWGPGHIAAATAAPDKAQAWGVPADHVFEFWDWVGGRYSLWSSVSLCCVVGLKDGVFERVLGGAADMDDHFRTAALERNVPIIAAMVQVWNREACKRGSYALIPYAERLRLLPAYMQQLEMESNGKHITRNGQTLTRPSAGVTWGAAGTNGQHSFFQLLHQGVDEIPVEFILFKDGHEGPPGHRAKLFANALAQSRALMVGKSAEAARAEMLAKGMSVAEADMLAPHRAFPGNRCSTTLCIDALSPEALGALIAFYEHRTFAQGVLAGINSFDQWGVELGKEMANQLAAPLQGGSEPQNLDPSTAAWIGRLKT
ncbi:MAG: glucose-6-phosphate isomerase [Proteobacteria bacterium]|nr:glucose-6-phosphate isomerase [Pseudomonadota bacterium]